MAENTPITPQVTRRDFVRAASASAGLLIFGLAGCDDAAVVAPDSEPEDTGVTVSGNTITLDISKGQASQVASPGGFLFIRSARTVVVNAGVIRAFTSVCTHSGCDVDRFESGAMICPCHNSRFNTDGGVISGPATGPLTEFDVARDGQIITISKI